MTKEKFNETLKTLFDEHAKFISRKNEPAKKNNGIFIRYKNPVVTAEHTPIFWKYDLDYNSNPQLIERLGINGTFNSGAIELNGKILLVVRVEGYDRKSFLAVAESENGVDNFKFWDYPIVMPETDDPDTNVYDARIMQHEDGWIYAVFCTERKDPGAPESDTSAAVAQAGIARTKNLIKWFIL